MTTTALTETPSAATKPHRFRFGLRTLLVSIAFLCVLLASLRILARTFLWPDNAEFEEVFSPIYQQFTADVLSGENATVSDQEKSGSWNPKSTRGSYELRGILAMNATEKSCVDVLNAVDRFVQTVTQKYHTEGDLPSSLGEDTQHVYSMWMYNWERRHGELHVWLFPYPGGDKIAFVVHHIEEKLE